MPFPAFWHGIEEFGRNTKILRKNGFKNLDDKNSTKNCFIVGLGIQLFALRLHLMAV
jgi:hypothetical protein